MSGVIDGFAGYRSARIWGSVWAGCAAIALISPSSAHACGGFFCQSSRPVDQAAEEILFAVDEEADTVTMHVKIEYQGEAEDFAWVVPVPGEPTIELGTDALFPLLSSLRAQFVLDRDFGTCSITVPGVSSTQDSSGGGGVVVVSTGAVGPFETVVLQATDSAGLVDWLQGHDFDIPDAFEGAVAPYVAAGQHFVALRLAKDQDAGDLQPISLTWAGQGLSIPIQLTSVAATPDMGLRVYVLGQHRAVPQSYLHLLINELAIDWWTGGANLEDVIVLAADEAGGHGFFTDYSGDAALVQDRLYNPFFDGMDDTIALTTTPYDALLTAASYGLAFDDDLTSALADGLGIPAGPVDGSFDLTDLLSCVFWSGSYGYYTEDDFESCYPDEVAAIDYDPAALAALLEERVLEPRRRTNQMLGAYPKITRLTSSLSPAEMTVDPTFVLNPDLPDVPLVRRAAEIYECGTDENAFSGSRILELSDGRSVSLPSIDELAALGLTEIEWLEQMGLTTPSNARIERTGEAGEPEVITDNSALLWGQLAAANAQTSAPEPGSAGGCGCASSGSAAGSLGLLGLVALIGRRRR